MQQLKIFKISFIIEKCFPILKFTRMGQIILAVGKGLAIKKLMPLVVIIGAHDVLRNFWIL